MTPSSNGMGEDDAQADVLNRQEAPRVEIYVADHCMVCEYAYEVADDIRTGFPQVDLAIVNISRTPEMIPELVFATPTYLLDGQLWSLGNPSPEDVKQRLSQALDQYGLSPGSEKPDHHHSESTEP